MIRVFGACSHPEVMEAVTEAFEDPKKESSGN
jgi:hypothetical protein